MPRRLMQSRYVWALVVVAWSRDASAVTPFEDPYDLPNAPRPPTLPELTHPDIEGTFESTFGVLTPKSNTPNWSSSSTVYVQRLGLEVPIGPRRWFVGGNYEAAFGDPPVGGSAAKIVGGNLEAYGRGVWATRSGLAFGGGLAMMFPVASFDRDSPGSKIANAAAAIRPWDYTFFDVDALTARPFVDMRAVDGRFVIQFRAQLHWSFLSGQSTRSTLAATTALYVGYRVGMVGVGLEAFELYFIDAPVADSARAYFTVSPSLRLMTPWVQPALSFLTSIADPLYPSSAQAFGIRLAFTGVWDRSLRRVEPTSEFNAN